MVPKLLGSQKRLDQIRVVDAATEPVTIRDPRAGVVSKYTADGIGLVVTIPNIEPNVFVFDRLKTAFAFTCYLHRGPNVKL
jgi:hypothetical protein